MSASLGALAEDGADLDAVTAAARRVIAGTRTIGMSLDTCTVPGSPKEMRIPEGKAELGLGIHGEAGIEQVGYTDARTAIAMVSDRLAAQMSDGPHVAIINNLGGSSVLEMSVLANELARSSIGARIGHVVGPAAMMTSLGMHGFSVSVYPATTEDLAALDAPTPLAAWPGLSRLGPVDVVELPDGLRPIRALASDHPGTRAFLARCCEILIAAEAARAGADRTADIVRARAGRASYLSADQIRGHVDPGAEAVARLFERLRDAGTVEA